MASLNDHISKAHHNENFFSSFDLDSTSYLDWAVNGLFYSALHYLDSYFAYHVKHPVTHRGRTNLIHADINLGRNFYVDLYRPLQEASEEARYHIRTFTPEEIRNDFVPLLEDIKNHLSQYITQIN